MFTNPKRYATSLKKCNVCLYTFFRFFAAVIPHLTVKCFLYKVHSRYIGSSYANIKIEHRDIWRGKNTSLKIHKALSPEHEKGQQAGIKMLLTT